MTTLATDDPIINFLIGEGVDEDEFEGWIDSFNSETPGLYDSFQEYYELSLAQVEMFSKVDWDGSDSDIAFELSNAYINSDYFHD